MNNNTGCCQINTTTKSRCLKCKNEANTVLAKTLESLLVDNVKNKLDSLDGFYFCKTPSCEVIYFKDDKLLYQADLKIEVGLKDRAKIHTTCYCFNWSKEKIKEQLLKYSKTNAIEDISSKMKDPGCSCESTNPSGRCCLADNKKAIVELKNDIGLE